MKTRMLLLLKKKIDFELQKKFHISQLPFDLITNHILIYLDYTDIILFLYVIRLCYKNEPDFMYQVKLQFMIASLHQTINDYAKFMFTTCRISTIRHIIGHWSPFSEDKNIQPIATLTWSDYGLPNIFIEDYLLEQHASYLVNKNLLQSRLSIHEETFFKHSYTFQLQQNRQKIFLYENPQCIIVADPFRCVYYNINETINLYNW